MNIAFLSNHVFPFHVGGSETVIKNVSECMAANGHNVYVYGCDATDDRIIGGVNISKCNQNNIVDIIKRHEKIIIYSDSFLLFNQVIKLISLLNKNITLFPVGMNASLKDSNIRNNLLRNADKVNFICHDNFYEDAIFLKTNNISFKVIPNGISRNEFNKRKKSIVKKDEYNILCVANTFPKKGHKELLDVCKVVNEKCKINLNICCHEPKWQIGRNLQKILQNQSSHMPYNVKWHINLDRSVLIEQFYDNDIFMLCSLKEVAPVCILEAAAASLPWISFDVGNVKSIEGGIVVPYVSKDITGHISPCEKDIEIFADYTNNMINDIALMQKLSDMGSIYADTVDWKNITKIYESYI